MPDFNLPDSALIPTTEIYEIEQLQINTPGLKEFLVQLTQTVNTTALMVNMKDTGYYYLNEFANSQYYFPPIVPPGTYNTIQEPRPVYRKVVNFGALPNTATKTVPHGIQGIDASFRFTRIYATATDPIALSYIPVPYVSSVAKAQDIELYVDVLNVNIATGFNYAAYTTTYVVLEYVKEPDA